MEKQTGINLIAQIIAFAINLIIGFFLTPFIVEHIGVEANGFVALANNFVEYAQLITIAINSMAGRFITIKIHQKDLKNAKKYFSSVFFINIAVSIALTIVSVLVILFINKLVNISDLILNDVRILWGFIFASFIISLFTSIFRVSTFVKNRLDLTAFCNIKGYLLKILIIILCYVFLDVHVWYIGLAVFIMNLYTLLKNIYFVKKLTPELKISRSFFDFKAIVELFKSGIWNTLSQLSSILSSGLDLLITNIFIGATAMGVLSLSKTIPMIMLSFFGTIAAIFAPSLTISYAKGDVEYLKKQLNNSIKLLSVLSSIALAIIIGFGRNFYALWAPTQNFSLLYWLTVVNCVSFIFSLPLEPLYNVFTAINKIKAPSLALIGFSVVSLTTIFILLKIAPNDTIIKMFIILGTSSLFNIIRVLTFLPIYGAKCLKFKLNTFYKPILKNTIVVILLSLIALGINSITNVNTWLRLVIACVATLMVGLMINNIIILNKNDRQKIYSLFKQKIGGLNKI